MSNLYDENLSPYSPGGSLGDKEIVDTKKRQNEFVDKLAADINNAKLVAVLCGAGCSTSAGIPDFRGPTGVWTMKKQNKKASSIDLISAKPTTTHHALVALANAGKIHHVTSQNVDGLLMRAGYPADRLVEPHGNFFVDKCSRCVTKIYRETEAVHYGCNNKEVGRCTSGRCRGSIRSSVIDWNDKLPFEYFNSSERYAHSADLFIVLGSSLTVAPANSLPKKTKKNKGAKVVYVNLQKLNLGYFDYFIHAKVDDIMSSLLKKMGIRIGEEVYPPNEPVLHSLICPDNDALKPLSPPKIKKARKGEDSSYCTPIKKIKHTEILGEEKLSTRNLKQEMVEEKNVDTLPEEKVNPANADALVGVEVMEENMTETEVTTKAEVIERSEATSFDSINGGGGLSEAAPLINGIEIETSVELENVESSSDFVATASVVVETLSEGIQPDEPPKVHQGNTEYIDGLVNGMDLIQQVKAAGEVETGIGRDASTNVAGGQEASLSGE